MWDFLKSVLYSLAFPSFMQLALQRRSSKFKFSRRPATGPRGASGGENRKKRTSATRLAPGHVHARSQFAIWFVTRFMDLPFNKEGGSAVVDCRNSDSSLLLLL